VALCHNLEEWRFQLHHCGSLRTSKYVFLKNHIFIEIFVDGISEIHYKIIVACVSVYMFSLTKLKFCVIIDSPYMYTTCFGLF
jgi:hypothetical protein